MSILIAALLLPGLALAQAQPQSPPAAGANAPAAATALPADPWPRQFELAKASVLIYQPQINSWQGNKLDFRAAVAIRPAGGKEESFGVVFGTAQTQVDKVARTVVLQNMAITKSDFPLLPDRGAAYAAELGKRAATATRTISLDRMEEALAAAGIKPPPIVVDNTPPQVFISQQPAILVPIDGAPVLKTLGDSRRLQRVINTRALIAKDTFVEAFYIRVYDGWLTADTIAGPWRQGDPGLLTRRELDDAAADLSKKGVIDLLDGGPSANPKPSLANGVPTIFTAQGPAELVIFDGQPNFVPIAGTQLLWASNTHNDVLIDTTSSLYYVLLAGRWFRGPALSGPWTFVAARALPADFARIPPTAPAGVVLPSVAGTPQAQSAMIANTIPQSATVPRKNGPTFTPNFDGVPQYRPIDGTPLAHVVNSSTPIIRVDPASYYAVSSGVWFAATAVTGPWVVATSVPAVIYGIPAASPLHYVTYVHVYGSTPQVVYTGYTPGYLGTVVTADGTVVYGTGYAYSPWVGTVWYPPPYTYGVAAVPVYNPYVGYTFGFAMGLATAAWMEPYWGGAWYYPAHYGPYPCCATASANVYSHWGSTTYSGTRTWYGGGGVAGTTTSGTYTNARTGTTGSFEGGRQYNAYTGNATRGYDRTMNTAAGGSGQVARASNYNTYTGQRTTANAASATGAGGSTDNRAGTTTAGPQGDAHIGGGQTYNAKTGQTNTWGTASVGNNHYADVNGNVYSNTGDGWQQKNGDGSTTRTSNPPSSVNSEAQARSTGDARSSNLGQSWGGGSGGSQSWDRGGGGGSQSWDRGGGGGGFDRGGGGWGGGGGFDRGGGGWGGGGGFDRGGGGWGGQHGLGESGGGWGGRFGGGGGFGGGRRR